MYARYFGRFGRFAYEFCKKKNCFLTRAFRHEPRIRPRIVLARSTHAHLYIICTRVAGFATKVVRDDVFSWKCRSSTGVGGGLRAPVVVVVVAACRRSRLSDRFRRADGPVHVGDQQHLDGMAHEQQDDRQQSGHGAVAAVAVLHGRRVFACNHITRDGRNGTIESLRRT